jgi:SAM-dependent methyltransferase
MQESQVEFFKLESWNYFQRNYQDKNIREVPMGPYLAPLLEKFPISIEGGSVLDIGCAAGNNLFRLKELLRANRAVGVEPSSLVTEADSKLFPEREFYQSDCRALPFRSGEFDLVVLIGVL